MGKRVGRWVGRRAITGLQETGDATACFHSRTHTEKHRVGSPRLGRGRELWTPRDSIVTIVRAGKTGSSRRPDGSRLEKRTGRILPGLGLGLGLGLDKTRNATICYVTRSRNLINNYLEMLIQKMFFVYQEKIIEKHVFSVLTFIFVIPDSKKC